MSRFTENNKIQFLSNSRKPWGTLAIIGKNIETAEEAADFVEIDYEEIQSTTNLKTAILFQTGTFMDILPNRIL